jgi:hypothetical protein
VLLFYGERSLSGKNALPVSLSPLLPNITGISLMLYLILVFEEFSGFMGRSNAPCVITLKYFTSMLIHRKIICNREDGWFSRL